MNERIFQFIHNPRTAGNSIKRSLGLDTEEIEHTPWSTWETCRPDALLWGVVRNPFCWLVSGCAYSLGLDPTPGDFLWWLTEPRAPRPLPWRPQWMQVGGCATILRYENLDAEFQKMWPEAPLLVREHASMRADPDFKAYYTPETREIAIMLYRTDLEYFHYEF